jgi:hypothetical protein
MYLTWMYLLILFMWQYRYMILMRSEYVYSSCYTCTICNVHVYVRLNVSCVVRWEIVCSLCYIFHALGLWYLPADVSNNLFLSICLLCMNFVVITTLLFVGLRVTYMYLYSFVLTLFSIQYYIYFVIILPQRSCRGYTGFTKPVCPSVCPPVCRQIICRTITWVVFLLKFYKLFNGEERRIPLFLAIFTFVVPELLDLIWRKIGCLPYVVW